MEEKHVLISGLVQGVGFRSQIIRHARLHGINGFVRNLPDGKVEICAQGDPGAIEKFFQEIRNNSGAAKIESFHVKLEKCGKIYSSFVVK